MDRHLLLKEPVHGHSQTWDNHLLELDVRFHRRFLTERLMDGAIRRHHLSWDVEVEATVEADSSNSAWSWVNKAFMQGEELYMEFGFEDCTKVSPKTQMLSLDLTVGASYMSWRMELVGTIFEQQDQLSVPPTIITCPDCKGSGKYVGFTDISVCDRCGGTGTTKE